MRIAVWAAFHHPRRPLQAWWGSVCPLLILTPTSDALSLRRHLRFTAIVVQSEGRRLPIQHLLEMAIHTSALVSRLFPCLGTPCTMRLVPGTPMVKGRLRHHLRAIHTKVNLCTCVPKVRPKGLKSVFLKQDPVFHLKPVLRAVDLMRNERGMHNVQLYQL